MEWTGEAVTAAGPVLLDTTVTSRANGWWVREQELSAADLGLGLRMLADALDAGLPIQRALGVFADLAPPAWGPAIPAMRSAVREGKSFAVALEEAPLRIPPLVIGMARAGEAGSGLALAIRRAAEHAEAAAAMREAVRSALAYPLVVALSGVGSLAVMVGVVIPRFATILRDLGQELPRSTRVVLAISEFAQVALLPGLVGLTLLVAAFATWRRTPHGRRALDAWLLGLPVIGPARLGAATARTSTALASLLASGVPLRRALQAAARATGDAELTVRIANACEAIAGGASLSRALGEAGAITPVAVRLVRAGEETGRLVALLEHAARIEQERTHRTITRAVRFLEPSLILLFASVVGLVAMSL